MTDGPIDDASAEVPDEASDGAVEPTTARTDEIDLNGKPVACTPKEIEILYTLASNPGKVFSREHLLQSIWGYDFLGDTRAVDSHIKRIRRKFREADADFDSIETLYGAGYRFSDE